MVLGCWSGKDLPHLSKGEDTSKEAIVHKEFEEEDLENRRIISDEYNDLNHWVEKGQ